MASSIASKNDAGPSEHLEEGCRMIHGNLPDNVSNKEIRTTEIIVKSGGIEYVVMEGQEARDFLLRRYPSRRKGKWHKRTP